MINLAPALPWVDVELYDKHIYEDLNLEVIYPVTDGRPMAESSYQMRYMIYLMTVLLAFFDADEEVYVAGNMLMFYEEGAPRRMIAPDIFIARGVGKHDRPSFKIWEENTAPCFIIEILSPSMVDNDQVMKKALYQKLGVDEYILLDPTGDLAKRPVEGFRLDGGVYRRIKSTRRDGVHAIFSEQLQLEIHTFKNGDVRLFDPTVDSYLNTYNDQARENVQQRREIERQQRENERQSSMIEQLMARLRALGEDVDDV